ncbi:MAG TPA: nucleotide exchange factor GrpE [Albitalea sp.]|nr:nucleotide exchange factor GrpE [Albitalea sp.]HUG26484.1 nucleotide exchange factor GrpE [Albitalea sp.]
MNTAAAFALETAGNGLTSAAVETSTDMATTENTQENQAVGTQDSASVPQTATPEALAPEAQQRLNELEAKHAEVADAYLRAKAESENTRRRAEEEISKARKFAVEAFAESLLPVKDSLEAAIAIPAATPEQLLEGVHATLRQLATALERNKVVEINPAPGSKFDPHQHQAISVVPAEQEANTVVAVLQKGYLIAERVLRPALVTVAAAK